MVVYSNASSPKRRRTDDAQATAQQILDTNATLHMFTSNRQNRWMHMQNLQNTSRGGRGEEGATGTSGNSGPRDNIQARDALPRPHTTIQPTDAQPLRPPALNVNTQTARAPPDLVNYESPYTTQFPTPMTAAAALQSRPPSASTPHPSLPSPAPSEEHANSPGGGTALPEKPGPSLQARIAPPKRGPGRPRKYPVDVHTVNQAAARSPNVGPRAPNTPSQLPTNMRIHTPTSNLAPSHSRTNSLTGTANVAVSPQQHTMRSPTKRPNNAGGLFGATRMQQRLDEYFKTLEQRLNPIDQGRKILLQEAIRKDDFFYVILNQVFCLYTCDRQSMPKQLGRVGHSSWVYLERLLCSNKAMSPLVVSWFASFPAPLHIIFASGESQFFMNQLVIIESFLHELPRRWDGMIAASKRMLAPPLVQDMIEELYLISQVVQTTAFRAIARIFWNDGEDNAGIRFLETLHKIDQDTYTFRQWRRSKSEREAAYGVYTYVHTAWQQTRMLPGVGDKEFVLPRAREFFEQPPPSMQQASNVGINGQVSRGDAQQMQLIETNNRILAQRQPVPGLSADQSRTLLQSSNRPVAQPSLPRNALQHLQNQPMQPLQPHPGHLINPPVLPSNGNAAQPNRNMPQMSAYQPSIHTFNHLSRLLPPANVPARPLPVQPDTARVSLHQAHLRSPVPGNRQLLAGAQPLYRHVTGYALPPTQLDNKLCAQSITLSVSQADLDRVPITTSGLLPGEPGIRTLQEGSALYRLRCCKMPPAKGFDTEASWVTAVNTWPDIFTFQFNGAYLEPRRKLHHGRCLPIDLSALLHAGTNTLNVYTVPSPTETGSYVVAIEQVGVSSHDTIVSAVNPISADDSLTAIKRSLESPPDEDDDIAMTSSTLTIPLFEPYRNDRICDTPVRGSACLHRECFDLETFLSQCKREQPGYPCVPDCWRCPICKGDVRPQTLVKDGFLVQVKEELAQKGLLDTRAIVVEEDGSWKPRVEAAPTGVRSASLEMEEAAAASAAMAAAANSGLSIAPGAQGKQKVVEVIELD